MALKPLARLVRDRRVKLLWTQATLARRSGVSRWTINNIERSRRAKTISPLVAGRLGDALGVNLLPYIGRERWRAE